ncbi:MAG: NAD(P)-binding domain-containing protein [Methanospirillaceae archaeon]|nr:NAD(P)-binding domain-containing protein [Methanospirillaceae archaeon]
MSKTTAFIGAGRVTRIILEGLARKNSLPDRIIIMDTDTGISQKLAESFPMIEQKTEPDEAIRTADFLFIGLHPPVVVEMLKQVTPYLGESTVIVSLAPKIKITTINQITGTDRAVIRMIPNAASYVNQGYNPVTFGPACTDAFRKAFSDLVLPLGLMPEVPEERLEAYAVITAMGPTYLWFQIAELISLGESFGLTRDDATRAVLSMTIGAVETVKESKITLEAVIDLIPVKPLADHEEAIRSMYKETLTGFYKKLIS